MRKLIHISAGTPCILLPFAALNYPELVPAIGGIMLMLSLWMTEKFPFFDLFAKPEEQRAHRLFGAFWYFVLIGSCLLIGGALSFWLRYPSVVYAQILPGIAWVSLAWGDGFSGVVGPKEGKSWFWSDRKTISGSLGFVAFGTLGLWGYLSLWGHVAPSIPFALGQPNGWIIGISLASVISTCCAFMESIETGFDDNIIVPITALVVGGIGLAIIL